MRHFLSLTAGGLILLVTLSGCSQSTNSSRVEINPTPAAATLPSATPTPTPTPGSSPTTTPQSTTPPSATPTPATTATPSPVPTATPASAPTALQNYSSSPITVDQACAANAPEAFAPLCDLLKQASAPLIEQCLAFGDSASCAALGGNVFGAVAACYAGAAQIDETQGRKVCKAADVLVSGIAAYCRAVPGAPAELCALFSSDLIAAELITRYQSSALHLGHQLQRELSAEQPMKDTLYPATHNSFNATDANVPPTLSGSDANQRYLLVDQLQMDIRGLELDIHWIPSLIDGGFRATVCHGNALHAGCTIEKSLRSELTELRSWLDANPKQVIVIDVESHLEEPQDGVFSPDRYASASADITQTIGDLLFLPLIDNPRACGEGQPLEASVQDVRAAGKQVILYGDCRYEDQGQALMFDRSGTHLQLGGGSYVGIQAPDNCVFSLDQIDQNWVRFFEDGTLVGALTGVDRQANIDEVREMARCNINMPSLDHLQPFDGRLQALLWSWEEGQPLLFESDALAVHIANGHFVALSANDVPNALACLNPEQPLILEGVINPTRWQIATTACPEGTQFSVPRNGLDNEALKQAKAAAQIETIRLNYSKPAGQNWQVGETTP